MDNQEFIELHRRDDVKALALRPCPDGVDMRWCLQQIDGWQRACVKLPLWAMDESGAVRSDIWFPPRISMEQCSSQETAQYKAMVAVNAMGGADCCHEMVDLTGGYGVDFSYMSRCFRRATYVERQPHLCDIMKHNAQLLGLDDVEIVNADGVEALHKLQGDNSGRMIFLDPARRDKAGRKVFALEDCTPDIVGMRDELLDRARVVIVKLSPMLDISQAIDKLKSVAQVHVISVRGECKELLLVLKRGNTGSSMSYCVNIADETSVFEHGGTVPLPVIADDVMQYLYEPNASILKAGVQDALCSRYNVWKLHANSNLFTGNVPINDFPGRCFCVQAAGSLGKKDAKKLLDGISKANLTVRNFPSDVDSLRRKLRLKEGGDVYLFATTMAGGRHLLIRCHKLAGC